MTEAPPEGRGAASAEDSPGDVARTDLDSDFVEVYTAHYPRLVRALRLGGLRRQAAEDVCQEAFARTLSHWGRVRRGSNPPGYVYRVAFRLARRSFREEAPLSWEPAGRDEVSGQVVDKVVAEAVIAAMPHRRRACVVACLVVGLPTSEAARALGLKEGTVRKQLERGRVDLRTALGDDVG